MKQSRNIASCFGFFVLSGAHPGQGEWYAIWMVARHDGVLRVEAETEPDNTASQRVLAKCGFVPNGIIGEEGPRYVRLHNQ
jgi:hypothetical protein